MSQSELAELMLTRQPAIARIESGRSNVGLNTLIRLGEALHATVRVDLQPVEALADYDGKLARWWDCYPRAAPEHELGWSGHVLGRGQPQSTAFELLGNEVQVSVVVTDEEFKQTISIGDLSAIDALFGVSEDEACQD